MDQETISRVALTLIPGIGSGISKKLVSQLGAAHEVFNKSKSELMKLPGLGEKNYNSLVQGKKYLDVAQSQIEHCNKLNIKIIHFNDPMYPTNLAQLHDSPFLFYFKGDTNCLQKKNIAIVGTRNSTNYGNEVTR